MSQSIKRAMLATLILASFEVANAQTFTQLGSALADALGTKKASQKKLTIGGKEENVFFAKDESGKTTKIAMVEKAIYEPNCTHTWVIGMTPDAKVEKITVVEMSCPHAFPAKAETYLDQYKGKGPNDAKSLKGEVKTIAKATGTCDLTTKAVVHSISTAQAFAKDKS